MMKKLLLGSTALVAGGLMAAPAMAADPIKIGVGGYYQFFVNAGGMEGFYALNGTSIQYKGLSFYQEGEIHFIGQTKLDNGTTVGITVELEGWNSGATNMNSSSTSVPNGGAVNQIDEAFIFAFGDWGRVEAGSRDQASYRMYYGVPSAAAVYTGPFQHNSLITGANNTNWKQWVAGLQFGWNGFTIGGSYSYDILGLGANYFTGVDNDNRKWGAGIMYETGPWQMSFEWRNVQNANGNGSLAGCNVASGTSVITTCTPTSTAAAWNSSQPQNGGLQFGNLSANMFQVAANYALGPGIKVIGGGNYYNVAGPTNTTAGQSWSLFLGMDLRF